MTGERDGYPYHFKGKGVQTDSHDPRPPPAEGAELKKFVCICADCLEPSWDYGVLPSV